MLKGNYLESTVLDLSLFAFLIQPIIIDSQNAHVVLRQKYTLSDVELELSKLLLEFDTEIAIPPCYCLRLLNLYLCSEIVEV